MRLNRAVGDRFLPALAPWPCGLDRSSHLTLVMRAEVFDRQYSIGRALTLARNRATVGNINASYDHVDSLIKMWGGSPSCRRGWHGTKYPSRSVLQHLRDDLMQCYLGRSRQTVAMVPSPRNSLFTARQQKLLRFPCPSLETPFTVNVNLLRARHIFSGKTG